MSPDLVTNESSEGNLAEVSGTASANLEEMEGNYDEARDRRLCHEISGTARDRLGALGFYGMFMTGTELAAYQEIDLQWELSEYDRTYATGKELEARKMNALDVSQASSSIALWENAAVLYARANDGFVSITEQYDAIKARHPDVPGYFA